MSKTELHGVDRRGGFFYPPLLLGATVVPDHLEAIVVVGPAMAIRKKLWPAGSSPAAWEYLQ